MSKNLLGDETSPYLLQHQHNPVHWRPWGPAALAEARDTNKPILLSVGYAACHWCHVMAHESFEDAGTAAVMNRLFVNIKVDREERPDIDQIYMTALHALGQQGGWPLTMFLTPNGEPFWGGTYFPKTAGFGRPAFTALLEEVARVFRDDRASVEQNRALLLERLREPPKEGALTLDSALLDAAADRLVGLIDPVHGGVRGAPKFPQPGLLGFLWRAAGRAGQDRYRKAVVETLRHICEGGIYDHLGGGFARYSVDERWLVPHFEKMLYDNGQLIGLLAGAAAATGEPLFRSRIEETAGWLKREMTLSGGAFAASIDADSEGEEGRFYVWTEAEIAALLDPADAALFASVYDVTPEGNWEGKTILNRLRAPATLGADDHARLAASRAVLLKHRAQRVPPALDDKVLADWNGLAIDGLALAGWLLDRPEWIDQARDAYGFILAHMTDGDRLAHSYRNGKRLFPGLATDYAAIIKAALTLHAATFEPAYVADAVRLADAIRAHHWDGSSAGYFLSADDAEALIVRPRSELDDVTPSATSQMATNLVTLWHITGNGAYRDDADAIFAAGGATVGSNLFSTTGLLSAVDLRLTATDVVIVHPHDQSPAALIAAAKQAWSPSLIISVFADVAALPVGHPAAGKTAKDGRAAAFVCRNETCSLPVTEPAGLFRQLTEAPR